MSDSWDALVIGAGFAGASAAWWLRRRGLSRILVLEREAAPGMRASGQNAGIARLPVSDPATARLTGRGGAMLREPPPGFAEGPLLDPTGGILLAGTAGGLESLRDASEAAGIPLTPLDRSEVLSRLPFLEDSPFRTALLCPQDGLVDIHAYLGAFLRGIRVEARTRVEAFEVRGGRIRRVETDRGTFEAERVILAAGAHSLELGRLAGGVAFPFVPKRRHLVYTGPLGWVPRGIPYVWYQSPEAYFKPEGRGLLLSPCDESDAPPMPPPVHPDAAVWLFDRIRKVFPGLLGVPVARIWAELRCFVPDRRFVIGRDPKVENLTWVTALGGHGMTASAAVGELASALAVGEPPPVDPEPYAPGRFA